MTKLADTFGHVLREKQEEGNHGRSLYFRYPPSPTTNAMRCQRLRLIERRLYIHKSSADDNSFDDLRLQIRDSGH
jgi:hypothetical protein